ncbi:hypothetical protein ACFL6D_02630 [Spirochaetota bacterium]
MIKIAFIGAGSYVFTRHLIRDILSFPSLSYVEKRNIYHAVALDPLTSAALSLEEIDTLVNELFRANKRWAKGFK